jgi:hypothetical protein
MREFVLKNRVFLGGTCNGTTWRDEMIKDLDVDYFNPVVDDWTSEAQAIEEDEKDNKCNIHLYVITDKMKGVFSIAEAVDSVHNKKVHTIFHVIPDGFDKFQLKSLEAVVKLINDRGGKAFVDSNLGVTTRFINYSYA